MLEVWGKFERSKTIVSIHLIAENAKAVNRRGRFDESISEVGAKLVISIGIFSRNVLFKGMSLHIVEQINKPRCVFGWSFGSVGMTKFNNMEFAQLILGYLS